MREEYDDWALLFDPDTSYAVGVNPMGVAIWKILDGQHDLPAIMAEIQTRFSAIPGAAEGEISTFIDQLVEQGFAGYPV